MFFLCKKANAPQAFCNEDDILCAAMPHFPEFLHCCVLTVNVWLVVISRRCDHPHHLHPGFLHQCERVLHCHLPRGHHPGHLAPAQHEEGGDGGQVCFLSLSHFQTDRSHCRTSANGNQHTAQQVCSLVSVTCESYFGVFCRMLLFKDQQK